MANKTMVLVFLLCFFMAFTFAKSSDDSDQDGVIDSKDNCINDYNPDQTDSDFDNIGDACDQCPYEYGPESNYGCPVQEPDNDQDGIPDSQDNCPYNYNKDQSDVDGDGVGDVCDSCDDRDNDQDGVKNCDDQCPNEYGTSADGCPVQSPDYDKDGYPDSQDNCPSVYNNDQSDSDGDGLGNVCDDCPNDFGSANGCPVTQQSDSDKDGVTDKEDNCPTTYNPDQLNVDGDLFGDVCDSCDDRDNDKDGVKNCDDQCPNEQETINGYQDSNGCPDTAPIIPGIPTIRANITKLFNDDNPGGQILVQASDVSGISLIDILVDDLSRGRCFNQAICGIHLPDLTVDSRVGVIVTNGIGNSSTFGDSTAPPIIQQNSFGDDDQDGINNLNDNCRNVSNNNQSDSDHDNIGDACDQCDLTRVCNYRLAGMTATCGSYLLIPFRQGEEYYHQIIYDRIASNGCGCLDSDGVNYFTPGQIYSESVTTVPVPPDAWGRGGGCGATSNCQQSSDRCIDASHLSEGYCGSNGPVYTIVTCPEGCANGACLCIDSDGGDNWYIQGELEGSQDYCYNDSHNRTRLREYYCGISSESSGYLATRERNVTCQYGCTNGACVCTDSDGGADYYVRGSIGNYDEHCFSNNSYERTLIEFNPIANGNNCSLREQSHICEGLCRDGACQPPSCSDGVINQNETDIDCGGPNCAACGYMRITGTLKYEESNPTNDGWYNQPDPSFGRFKPIRYVTVWLLPSGQSTLTDSNGRFEFVVPRSVGTRYGLRIKPSNYAAQIEKDYDGCNEYVWFDSEFQLTTPSTGQMDFGELDVYVTQYTDSQWGSIRSVTHPYPASLGGNVSVSDDFVGKWHEEYSCVEILGINFGCFCGTPDNNLNLGGAAYFNIGEDLVLAYEYVAHNRDPSDTMDPIRRADVQYPDSVGPLYSNDWDEIDLPFRNADGYQVGLYDKDIFHEYGHAIEDDLSEVDGVSGSHNLCTRSDEEDAWGEGFAEFFSGYMTNKYRNDPQHYTSSAGAQYNYLEEPGCNTGWDIEGGIAAMLWDLVDAPGTDYPDSTNESFDTISGQDRAILYILDTEMNNIDDAPDVCQFVWGSQGWKNHFSGQPLDTAIDPILTHYGITNDC
ncbi:Thrombospondin type 3 repeat protein [Candidatus Bilamarchaeum dharawalense]|uniref:Thrombospondin type 3 repeat protein n=1 Tax=Candidatus Bilamarchaeum dharawalense TaxID=2885759 RepID=A0A5E4LMX0_9ARCH|nr:Thrombospondin type 3 repeat protein [Candidatus Bilamarchaeum dharawalense]